MKADDLIQPGDLVIHHPRLPLGSMWSDKKTGQRFDAPPGSIFLILDVEREDHSPQVNRPPRLRKESIRRENLQYLKTTVLWEGRVVYGEFYSGSGFYAGLELISRTKEEP